MKTVTESRYFHLRMMRILHGIGLFSKFLSTYALRLLLFGLNNIPRAPKIYLVLTLYFEAVTTIITGILGFLVFPDLYNLFETLLICFHGLMNK